MQLRLLRRNQVKHIKCVNLLQQRKRRDNKQLVFVYNGEIRYDNGRMDVRRVTSSTHSFRC